MLRSFLPALLIGCATASALPPDAAKQMQALQPTAAVETLPGGRWKIIERFIPGQIKPMRAANQQRWRLDFSAINAVHVPVALASILLLAAIFAWRWWWRGFDDLTLLAATVSSAVLGNAFICAVISGPHDRYGARLAWVATFVVLISAIRSFSGDDDRSPYGRANRNSATPAL